MPKRDLSPRDRLLNVATGLFAELGYDQTTSEMIADASGLPLSSITEEFGGRRQLYLAVFTRVRSDVQELITQFTGLEPTRKTYHKFIDAYLDYLSENPAHAALWLQRWLNDAADLREIERAYVVPQAKDVVGFFKEVFRDDVDAELLAWTLAWSAQVFTLSGIPGHEPKRDQRDVARFRHHLHALLDRVLKE